jgi:hypothetical protein
MSSLAHAGRWYSSADGQRKRYGRSTPCSATMTCWSPSRYFPNSSIGTAPPTRSVSY